MHTTVLFIGEVLKNINVVIYTDAYVLLILYSSFILYHIVFDDVCFVRRNIQQKKDGSKTLNTVKVRLAYTLCTV